MMNDPQQKKDAVRDSDPDDIDVSSISEPAHSQWTMWWHRLCQVFTHPLAQHRNNAEIPHHDAAKADLHDMCEHNFVDVTSSGRAFAPLLLLSSGNVFADHRQPS